MKTAHVHALEPTPAQSVINDLMMRTGMSVENIAHYIGVAKTTVKQWLKDPEKKISDYCVLKNIRVLTDCLEAGLPIKPPSPENRRFRTLDKTLEFNGAGKQHNTKIEYLHEIGRSWDIIPIEEVIPGGDDHTGSVVVANLNHIGVYLMGDFQLYTKGEIRSVKFMGNEKFRLIHEYLVAHGASFLKMKGNFRDRTVDEMHSQYLKNPHCYRHPPVGMRCWESDKVKTYQFVKV